METIVHLVFGTGPDLTTWQMAARGAGMFVIALAMVRLSGRRSFGLRTPFDSCTTVLLGAILSRAVVGASDFWPTVAGAAALVLMHRLTGMASVRWPWLEQLVDGRERELVRAGQVDEAELRKALVHPSRSSRGAAAKDGQRRSRACRQGHPRAERRDHGADEILNGL